MALCPKCLVEGVVSGGQLLPADEFTLEFEFTFSPDADDEVEGERTVSFSGEIVNRHERTNSVSAVGTLRGGFGVADEDLMADATVETYARDGALAFIALTVRDGAGRVTFAANLWPGESDESAGLQGTVFLGWPTLSEAD